ncbi:MAG: radical SAM protein [Bacteroidia bacterium]|jgi:DNA repair photolyase|nr:radical SAM protein [Bacteroidia bacterium]
MPASIEVKTVLRKTKHRDGWFLDDYTLNLYSSCSFNCLYCYIRGSKYGINLAEKLTRKSNALELLEKQLALRARKNQHGIVVLSSATDPYLPTDEKYLLTREALKLLLKFRFPVHVITKSPAVERDFDLLQEIDAIAVIPTDLATRLKRGTLLTFSFSTLHTETGKRFEPGAPDPQLRLAALKNAAAAGLHTGVSLMPLLPFISDTGDQLINYYQTFSKAGAAYLFPATLTLHGNLPEHSKTLVLAAVAQHYPQLLPKYQKWFQHADQMPLRYRDAFYQRVNELSRIYKLPMSALTHV